MSLFSEFAKGFVHGVGLAASDPFPRRSGSPVGGMQVVESLCRAAGWPVSEYVAENAVVLYFKSPIVQVRRLLIAVGMNGEAATFTLFSGAEVPPARLPPEAGYFLLARNIEGLFYSWQMFDAGGGNVGFAAKYTAFLDGLDVNTFRVICDGLSAEVHLVDTRLRESGLL